jgi:hypothetical protein
MSSKSVNSSTGWPRISHELMEQAHRDVDAERKRLNLPPWDWTKHPRISQGPPLHRAHWKKTPKSSQTAKSLSEVKRAIWG